MKTTVDIPDEALEEAMRHTKARTKREAVVTAIIDFNRRQRLQELSEGFGSSDTFMTREELLALREKG